MNILNKKRKHIVVVGGGFAGLNFVRKLVKNPYYDITVVDKNNYNYFTPLIYQVATGFLEPAAISYPFRSLFKNKNITFRMAKVLEVDDQSRKIYLSDGGRLEYDILVVAMGTKTNFFGNQSIQKNAFSLKGIDDALYMRNELIKTFEKASIETNPFERQKLLTLVIAGGGATGVELAGMMAELNNHILKRDYPIFKEQSMIIYLVEAAPYLLPPMSTKTHISAFNALQRLGIRVKLNTRVSSFEDEIVQLSDGTIIASTTLIWTGGVTANSLDGIAQESLGNGNRLVTDHFNRVQGYEDIYAIGDISLQYTDKLYPNGHPQLAQPAIQQGKNLAKNLILLAQGKHMKPFKYFDRGDMAIIGRKWAVADLFKHRIHIGGLLGLLGWLFIHLFSLLNYNNRVKTLYNWLIAYITQDQVLRMVFQPEKTQTDHEPKKDKSIKNNLTYVKKNNLLKFSLGDKN